MSREWGSYRKTKIAIAILICSLVAFAIAGHLTHVTLIKSIQSSSKMTTDDFTGIMDNYEHSFQLFESIVQVEIGKNSDGKKIAEFLKSNDKKFQQIEGADYDGVYIYYNGQYIYSWDTPYSEYEKNGYDATTRPWYKGAVAAKGKICFSVPYRSYANEYMLATISRMQPDGKTVIAYDIKLGKIQSFADKLNVFDGSFTMVCDEEGNIIGTTEPLYAGGNYKLSEKEYQQEIENANQELAKALEDEKEKASKKVESLKALQQFCGDEQQCITESVATPKRLHFNWHSMDISYAYSNGRYQCITLIPLGEVLSSALETWIIVEVMLLLALFLMDNLMGRLHHAKELDKRNVELANAVIRADEASMAKSQFLARMSHEIRTPMNAVIGETTIAQRSIDSKEKVSECLDKIVMSSRHLLNLINDILDMSAIESNKIKIAKVEFDIKEIVNSITTIYYSQCRDKGLHFAAKMINTSKEIVIGDQLRIQQCILNLLSNAVKFTPKGGSITFTLEEENVKKNDWILHICVEDTGSGMSEEYMQRIFRPFEQETSLTAKEHGGSGLGLSITKNLVELMGGTIGVVSQQGVGTKFMLDIPVVEADSQTQVTTKEIASIHTIVIDDDPVELEYISGILDHIGITYDLATSGKEAIKKITKARNDQHMYKLCLIDWKMKDMDGLETARRIREVCGDGPMVVVASAYDLNEIRDQAEEMGVDACISKPLFQSTIFNVLMSLSQGKLINRNVKPEEYDFTGRRILLVDDIDINRDIAGQLLEMVHFQVEHAQNGKDAVDKFLISPAGTYDVILMDVQMPVMNGYDATRVIRASDHPDAKDIIIIAMTANAFAEDIAKSLDAGMNDHISKPIDMGLMYEVLERYLD